MLCPFATASRFTLPFIRCRYCRTPPLSHAACASMSTTTTTTTTTTRDRGDRYGPIEWTQLDIINGMDTQYSTNNAIRTFGLPSKQTIALRNACERPLPSRVTDNDLSFDDTFKFFLSKYNCNMSKKIIINNCHNFANNFCILYNWVEIQQEKPLTTLSGSMWTSSYGDVRVSSSASRIIASSTSLFRAFYNHHHHQSCIALHTPDRHNSNEQITLCTVHAGWQRANSAFDCILF